MTYIQQAIEKAMGGGWKNKPPLQYTSVRFPIGNDIFTLDCMFLDPLFWQSLGKAEGKENEYIEFSIWRSVSSSDISKTIWWIAQWHIFIDHIAEGYGPEGFFKTLLTNSK